MTPGKGVLSLIFGGGLALTMLYRAFIALAPLTPQAQQITFIGCEIGLAAFFFGLYVLLRDWLQKPATGPAWWQQPAALAIVAANLVPAVGVLYLGWPIFPLLLLFWLETLVAFAFVIVRVGQVDGLFGALKSALVFVLFWTMYGVFVFVIFGWEILHDLELDFGPSAVPALIKEFRLGWPLLAVMACQGMLFFSYLSRRRAAEGTIDLAEAAFMAAPMLRLLLLHLMIVGGGLLAEEVGSPAGVLLMLVALKTALELGMHLAMQSSPSKLEAAKVDVVKLQSGSSTD